MPQWQKVDKLEGSAEGLEEEAVPRSESVDMDECLTGSQRSSCTNAGRSLHPPLNLCALH